MKSLLVTPTKLNAALCLTDANLSSLESMVSDLTAEVKCVITKPVLLLIDFMRLFMGLFSA